jgi:1-acyl-sn-glycerol-3-phosphate acyltransferase
MPSESIRDTKLGRRMITVPAIFATAVVMVFAVIPLLVIGAIFDLVRGKVRLPTPRVILFGVVYLGWEIFGVTAATVLWFLAGFGTQLHRSAFIRAHRWLQVSWANNLLSAMRMFLRLRVQAEGTDCIAPGPVIVFSRHASMVDTILPAHLITTFGHLDLRYVLKHELLWDPAIDIVASRIPNHFVDRSGKDTAGELAKIGALAAGMGPTESFTIFPEGSRFTPAKRERAIARLDDSDPASAAKARSLTHTMPPRPGGVLTVLDAAPDADVIIVAHTGLEGLAGPKDMWKAAPFRKPVQVQLWRVPRTLVPDDEVGRMEWIFDEWAKVDAWVAARV